METNHIINSRRKIIKQAALLSAFFLIPKYAKGLFTTDKSKGFWPEITDYARWCPTVHNLQPHKLKIISPTEALLHYDSSRLLPVEDPGCIFTTVAMGVFIDHLSIAAGLYNYKVIHTVITSIDINKKGIVPFALLKLVPVEHKQYLDRDLIKKRRTSREHYKHEPVDEDFLMQIAAQTNIYGHAFYHTSNKNDINFIINLNQKTLFEDISQTSTRKELDSLFRYTQREAETKKDGLWAKCMGFPGGMMKEVFRHHEKWEEGPLKIMLSTYYKLSFRGTSTIGWFRGPFDNTDDWIHAGFVLSRNWLLMTRNDFYIQPFGSLITNANAYQKLTARFHQQGNDSKLWMIFRMGHSNVPARSYRLDLNEILI